ncbi:hypothetical protein GUJ93_ZPchr0002g22949 [Zizania palustris]|uniref:Uncharacterized protein n=1 Tax=Zizania palustris TaxID=103762 RepID=A0A8J5VUH1_ZIZPA|nr:hypothetical protein GUJ93_ZPchr0002g22949 [Zizania palustris]
MIQIPNPSDNFARSQDLRGRGKSEEAGVGVENAHAELTPAIQAPRTLANASFDKRGKSPPAKSSRVAKLLKRG